MKQTPNSSFNANGTYNDINNTITLIENLPINDFIELELTNNGHVLKTWNGFDASISIPDLKRLAAFYKEWHEKL
jgi:hypothetical protein